MVFVFPATPPVARDVSSHASSHDGRSQLFSMRWHVVLPRLGIIMLLGTGRR